jgi:hypothetical protein
LCSTVLPANLPVTFLYVPMRGAAAEIHRNIRAAQGERGIKHMVFAHKIVIDTNNAVTFFQLSTVGLETVEMNHVGQRAKDTILGVDKSGGGRCTPEPVRERVRLFPRKKSGGSHPCRPGELPNAGTFSDYSDYCR